MRLRRKAKQAVSTPTWVRLDVIVDQPAVIHAERAGDLAAKPPAAAA